MTWHNGGCVLGTSWNLHWDSNNVGEDNFFLKILVVVEQIVTNYKNIIILIFIYIYLKKKLNKDN